ncbi:MAG: ABC transporter substrate-binding protein [bacterium]|nr:ABC transporter substrate-binding protein [bacterium]
MKNKKSNLNAKLTAFTLTLILCLLTFVLNAVAEETPLNLIKDTINKVVEVNKRLSGETNLTERRKELRAIIAPYFDFDEMAKRSLGAHWETVTEIQRKDFIEVFSELLARTYLSRIDKVTTQIVEFQGEKITPPKASVKTTINYKGDSFPIEYKFLQEESAWKVYDVVIENIGLVANYRNEFAGIIRKEKFEGLMEKLKKKLESNEKVVTARSLLNNSMFL